MGCNTFLTNEDDRMLEESARGENFDPDLKNLEESLSKEIGEARDELQRSVEEAAKDETGEKFDKIRAAWNQLRNEVREILPLARVETEQRTGTPATIKASERWDNSGLFSKGQIESFLSSSAMYQAISSRVNGTFFRGQSDGQYGEAKSTGEDRYNLDVYHPTFEKLANREMPILGIQEKVAEEILVTIGHESAEVYWKEFMTEEQKDRWREICTESHFQGKEEISPYAKAVEKTFDPKIDPEKEKFCEWVGYFELRRDNICRIDENKYDFIKTLYSSLTED